VLDAIRHFVRERLVGPADEPGPEGPSRVQLAACALLLELAHADGEFSEEERRQIHGTVERYFGVDAATGAELLHLAEAERAQSLDHFQFTRLIAEQYDQVRKLALAEMMWGVILADGRLSDLETHLVRKFGSLMQLTPADLAQARRAAAGQD
jgi:uncharacterized tellurite resistance protein B-like protein